MYDFGGCDGCDGCRTPPILRLPDEILESIFRFVDDFSIFSVSEVCQRFYTISSYPIAWRDRCTEYQFWEPHHAFHEKLRLPNPSDGNWKNLLLKRYKTDQRVTKLLNKIISTSTKRISRFEKIANEGYDAKDCLQVHLGVDDVEDVLARRYYASEALAFIHRRRAIAIWKRIASEPNSSTPSNSSLEEALGAYDLFVTRGAYRDIDQITRALDNLADQFRFQHPHFSDMKPRELATSVIAFMRRVGFTGASYENYHAFRNSFIGICVDSCRATLPLTTVAIFCALGCRLGIDVKPCELTYHVVAMVTDHSDPTLSPEERISFWDPYKSHLEIFQSDLEHQLRLVGVHRPYLVPSNTKDLVIRVSRNILSSVRHSGPQSTPWGSERAADIDHAHEPERHAALYAALTASVICGTQASTRFLEHMCTLMQRDFYMDVGFFENDMSRLIELDDRLLLTNICNAVRKEDATPKKPMRRHPRLLEADQDRVTQGLGEGPMQVVDEKDRQFREDISIRYGVGSIFRHRRYNYEAVITGWTRNCATSENWISSMDVDKLTRGRNQPFYNVFVADGSSRYVAEDNIMEVRPGVEGQGSTENVEMVGEQGTRACEAVVGQDHVLCGFLVIGKYFKRFDKEKGRFVSNLTEEYPDD